MTLAEGCTILEAVHQRECAELRAERDSYRLLAVQAIHHAHHLQVNNVKLQKRNEALREAWRLAHGFVSEAEFSDRADTDRDAGTQRAA